jgi:hypothetical protein
MKRTYDEVIDKSLLSRINDAQKRCIALIVTGIVAILFLHNPIDGYDTGYEYSTTDWARKECSGADWDEYNSLDNSMKNLQRKNELQYKCYDLIPSYRSVEREFPDWYSNSPVVPWLGAITHLFAAVGFLTVLGVIWFFVLSTSADPKNAGSTGTTGAENEQV